MDFEEQEDDEMEMEAASYDSHSHGGGGGPATTPAATKLPMPTSELVGPRPTTNNHRIGPPATRYRECLKNHAVGLGGHALDGCGEFLPSGPDGSLDALKCAACSCHRNFHRRDHLDGGGGLLHHHFGALAHHPYPSPFYRAPAGYLQVRAPPPLALPSTSGEEDVSNIPASTSGGNKKRFRTKFTAEQRERMLGLAERIGWRIQKHDEPLVQDFCSDTGVRRHVLKVWMHNNKHTLGKKP